MPRAWVLDLLRDIPPEPIALRAWAYKNLGPSSKKVHDRQDPKPFRVSFLGKGKAEAIRISILDDALADELAVRLPDRFCLGSVNVHLRQAERHPWSGFWSWEDLYAVKPSSTLVLEFKTPTFFRRQGVNYAIPEPTLILRSLERSWSIYSPYPIPPGLAKQMANRTSVTDLKIRSLAHKGHHRVNGFVGRVTLHLPRATEEEALWLSRLGELAFFSGVGAKTTLGFGLARRYELREGTHPDRGAHRRAPRRQP